METEDPEQIKNRENMKIREYQDKTSCKKTGSPDEFGMSQSFECMEQGDDRALDHVVQAFFMMSAWYQVGLFDF